MHFAALLLLFAGVTAAPAGRALSECDPYWADNMGFDCAVYEGANWCTADGGYGEGWCDALVDPEGCTLKWGPSYRWGSFAYQAGPNNPTAPEACSGCGSSCPPAHHTRTPIEFPAGCSDYARDAEGNFWRDTYGYSCLAYQYGNFCKPNPTGLGPEYIPDNDPGLWKISSYGFMAAYKWHTYIPDTGEIEKQDARFACCVCGGGMN